MFLKYRIISALITGKIIHIFIRAERHSFFVFSYFRPSFNGCLLIAQWNRKLLIIWQFVFFPSLSLSPLAYSKTLIESFNFPRRLSWQNAGFQLELLELTDSFDLLKNRSNRNAQKNYEIVFKEWHWAVLIIHFMAIITGKTVVIIGS